MLTVRTSCAYHPPPPAIKSPFSTSCVPCCIPSIGILGNVGYVPPGKQRPGSEAGKEFGDYPASAPCLTSRNTEAQARQESDLRCHRDSLTLLPTAPPGWRAAFPSTPDLMTSSQHPFVLVPIVQMRKLRLIEDKRHIEVTG